MQAKIEQRSLGSQGLVVSAQGFGAMGMTAFYENSSVSEQEKLAVFGETNEELVGKALKIYGRENFVIATKTGILFQNGQMQISNHPDVIRSQIEESLQRLGIDCIDLYYIHRIDRSIPIEDTMKLLLDLKNQGKIKYVGLSECSAEELERAHGIFPVTAIQMEWSLQTRDIEEKVVPMARKLGVGIVAYSPLGRGFLSRTFTKKEEINDWRSKMPRFSEENFEKNAKKCEELEKYSQQKGVTPAQLALAWVHKRGLDVFPIPGTKSVKRLEENSKAAFINLNEQECLEIESLVPDASGSRYDEERMKFTHSFGSI